jgi:hypothetical protein
MHDVQLADLRRLAEAVVGTNWRAGNYYGKPFIPAYQVIADTPDGPCVVLEGNKNFHEQAIAIAAYAAALEPSKILAFLADYEAQAARIAALEASLAARPAPPGFDKVTLLRDAHVQYAAHTDARATSAPPAPAAPEAAMPPDGYVLLPKQCPSWLEDVYDAKCEEDQCGNQCLYLPAYDAMVEALASDQHATQAPPAESPRVGYVCHRCSVPTPPPAPYKMSVECPACGKTTAATAAAALDRRGFRVSAGAPGSDRVAIPRELAHRLLVWIDNFPHSTHDEDTLRLAVQGKESVDALLVENEQLHARERACPTMQEGESRALLRGLQEVGAIMGLKNPSPADLVAAAQRLHTRAGKLAEQLQTAHAFVENTEAFGLAARKGLLQCGNVTWNIDQSKALLRLPSQAAPAQEE